MPTPTFIFPSAPALSASAIYALDVFADKPVFQPESASFTRATTATRTNSSGLIETVDAGIARVDWSGSGAPNTLLEPQRTNLLINSVWAGGTTVPTGWNLGGTGISTRVTSIKNPNVSAFNFDSSVARVYFFQGQPFTINTTSSLSVYVESVITPIPVERLLAVVNAFGTSTYFKGSTNINPATNIEPGNTYTLIFSATSTTLGSEVRIGQSNSGTIGNVTTSMPQLELGAYATSYIPTTSTSVTRNADVFNLSNVYTSGKITSAGGTWFVDFKGNVDLIRNGSSGGIFLNTGTGSLAGDGFLFRNVSSLSGKINIAKYISGTGTTLYNTLTENVKAAIKWDGTNADVFVNGVKVVSATAFTITAMENLIGQGFNRNLNINSMALYPTPILDADCIELTTL
jgi:hypothetical protein